MASIILKSLVKRYSPQVTAVNQIDLEVRDKEFLVLLGASGCGKSTLLRMIAGIEDITSGEIYIDSTLVNDVEPKDRDVAMVFQNYALYPHMSVYDNMAFGLKIKRVPRKEIKERIEKAAGVLEIEALLKRFPNQLSGGQRQRVAIGRAIVKEPKVFLMDEPLSNLDAKLRHQMRLAIKKLHQRLQCTFVYVTHDQVEAVTLGDRIAIMDQGQIRQIGTPKEIIDCPKDTYVAGFIGTPQMNIVEGVYQKRGEKSSVRIPGAELEIDSRLYERVEHDAQLLVGIRPEHCAIAEKGRGAVEMTVDICEVVGTEMLVHLSYGGNPFVVRTNIETMYEQGQEVSVTLANEKIHLFDGQSQMNLRQAQ